MMSRLTLRLVCCAKHGRTGRSPSEGPGGDKGRTSRMCVQLQGMPANDRHLTHGSGCSFNCCRLTPHAFITTHRLAIEVSTSPIQQIARHGCIISIDISRGTKERGW